MDQSRPNFFSGPYVDRRAEAREEAGWLGAALADPATIYLFAKGTAQLLHTKPEPRIAFVTREHPALREVSERQFVLLGWFRGARSVLVELETDSAVELPEGATFEELRPLTPLLRGDEAGLLAYARALTIWRARHRFCGVCGSATAPERSGHVMRCTNPVCQHEVFPRIDPAIIVLVTDGERALLGRQASWPPGRYSTIAGFVEPGESLEDAVAREVMEETAVQVTGATYHSSQPWPFPSSLMLGFQATAAPGSPVKVTGELEDAGWFTREQIESGTTLVPPSHSISYRLISAWLKRDT
ncbi:MAG TPA: NAD(+) diphosphatase [Steroidobacteraceae bacterium]|nr:NAD(+) diphosphatase [Steroidobacteraceae bacterium]